MTAVSARFASLLRTTYQHALRVRVGSASDGIAIVRGIDYAVTRMHNMLVDSNLGLRLDARAHVFLDHFLDLRADQSGL